MYLQFCAELYHCTMLIGWLVFHFGFFIIPLLGWTYNVFGPSYDPFDLTLSKNKTSLYISEFFIYLIQEHRINIIEISIHMYHQTYPPLPPPIGQSQYTA